MKIAVIGAGISGLTAAHLLSRAHEVHVFESDRAVGGHTHTVPVPVGDRTYNVDMGFIVFNERTYPNFIALMQQLGVTWQPSDMSFSVQSADTGIEFCPSSLDRLFAQRRNLLRPWFLRMILELLLFRRHMQGLRRTRDDGKTLNDFLRQKGYSKAFHDLFIMPMGSAIWSSDLRQFKSFPAHFFAEFFHNHGFLDIQQPQWMAITGGSRSYIAPLTQPFADNIHCGRPVEEIRRHGDHVEIKTRGEDRQRYDAAVIATHSNQALAMLKDPSRSEEEILGAIAYQPNDVVLHTDTTLLPENRKTWASWNYFIPRHASDGATLTYNMNYLQKLDAPKTFCVSLNRNDDIDADKVIRRLVSHHPVYTPESLAARRRHDEINGERRTYYCGAYWGYGFHEDGVNSALAVSKKFSIGLAA